MDKKQIFILSILALFTLLLASTAFYQYDRHQVKVDTTVQRAQAQRRAAIQEADSLRTQYTLQQKSDQNVIQTQGTAIARLCGLVTKAKLTDPACH